MNCGVKYNFILPTLNLNNICNKFLY